MWGQLAKAGEDALRLAGDLELESLRSPRGGTSEEPAKDPLAEFGQGALSLSAGPVLNYGVVVDAVPHARFYRVLPAGAGTFLPCRYATQGSTSPVGVAGGVTLQPNTPVLFVRLPGDPFGTILCPIPRPRGDGRLMKPDAIFQGLVSGLRFDRGHQAPFKLPEKGKIVDWSNRTPVDSTELSELFYVSETGLMLSVDSFLAQLRVDEETGLFLFYQDRLARLAGRNLQIWSGGSVEEVLIDRDEVAGYRGFAGRPYEQQGRLTPGQPYRENQTVGNGSARLEPSEAAAQPFHRLQEFYGHLGGMYRRLVCAPPQGEDWYRYGDRSSPIGLAEESWSVNGQIGIRSAGGIVIAKRPSIPAPKRVRVPADPDGDGDGYDPGSHFATPRPFVEGDHQAPRAAAGVLDLHAQLFNWESAHPFHHHENDFEYQEEGETFLGEDAPAIDFSALQSEPFLPPPETRRVQVTPRADGGVDIYLNTSHVSLLPDGGVVIGDGYASEIRMTGGEISLAAPGDVNIMAGRNLVLWGGREVVVKGRNGVQVAASEGPVEVKAETGMRMIADNAGGNNGMFFESRSSGYATELLEPGEDTRVPGISFLSRNSQIVHWGNAIYHRSGSGGITLDAARGAAPLTVHANEAVRFLATGAADFFGVEGNYTKANVFTPTLTDVGSDSVVLRGRLNVVGDVNAGGDLVSVGGHVYTAAATGPIGAAADGVIQKLDGRGYQLYEAIQEDLAETLAPVYQTALLDPWYVEAYAGNDLVVATVAASLRTSEQLRTENFVIFEPRWAQLREPAIRGGGWSEPVVLGPNGVETYPYPGERGAETGSYLRQPLTLHDDERGVARDRDPELYADPALAEPDETRVHGNFPTID